MIKAKKTGNYLFPEIIFSQKTPSYCIRRGWCLTSEVFIAQEPRLQPRQALAVRELFSVKLCW